MRSGRNRLFTCLSALLLSLFGAWLLAEENSGANAPTPDPLITKNLYGSSVELGDNFRFSIEASGAAPLRYQWSRNGAVLPGATNSQLTLTNIAIVNEGFYQVNIANDQSKTNSSSVFLDVVNVPSRILITDNFQEIGQNQAKAQVRLVANGQESAISFSLSYRTDRFKDPTLVLANPGFQVSADLSRSQDGLVGFTISAAPGSTFPHGDLTLGDLIFKYAGANNPFEGALNFTNQPVALRGLDFLNKSVRTLTAVRPQLLNTNTPLVLNPQSGLFEQVLTIVNPSGVLFSNVNTVVYWPTNAVPSGTFVSLNNSQGLVQRDFTGDGLMESVSLIQSSELQPGTLKLLTLEYYISDRTTMINPSFALEVQPYVARPTRTPATLVPILTNRFFNGSFHVEFPTKKNWEYFIEYADTMEQMNAGEVRTAIPTIKGTGSRMQWIDSGPPKTITPAFPGSRFYRVRELR